MQVGPMNMQERAMRTAGENQLSFFAVESDEGIGKFQGLHPERIFYFLMDLPTQFVINARTNLEARAHATRGLASCVLLLEYLQNSL
jgi:hypothetical protein